MSSTEKATRCMPISLGRVGSLSIASGWMYSKSSRRPLPSGVWSIAMLAWLPSSPTAVSVHSPLTVSRPRTVSPRSVKKEIVASRSRTAMPTFSSLMGMRRRLPRHDDPTIRHDRASSPYSTSGRTPYVRAKPVRRHTVVDVAQLTEPVQRWFTQHRADSDGATASRLPVGVRIRRRKDNQVAACARLLGIVSAENGYPRPRPVSRLGWLTGDDVLDAWIAEQHGRIQGHVAITRADSDPATAFRLREVTGRPASELAGVSRLFVRSSLRGQGLGTALLETAVEECRSRGLMPVAEMVSTIRGGVPLYDRAGWRMVAMYPCGKRGEGLETYLYVAPPVDARSRTT